jgi:hypothetical protein
MSEWTERFENQYKPFLNVNVSAKKRGLVASLYQRATGFEIILTELLKIRNTGFKIIETGSTRKPNNWKDGNSGVLFADFVKHHRGSVRSVDINQAAVDAANAFIDPVYHLAECSDSVTWLQQQADLNQVDLFYLDSYDVDWHNDQPSAEHHLREFLVIEPHLKPGVIVAIDDNSRLLEHNARTGKGRRIVEYLEQKGIHPLYDDYQIIYKL